MRLSTGVDIISLAEIGKTLADPAQLQRMLHTSDIIRSDPEHIAGRIALKEATIKALSLPPGSWLDIHVHVAPNGKPLVSVTDKPAKLMSMDGSISHHGDTAIGFVVALFDDEDE